jgi:hypothetical protein
MYVQVITSVVTTAVVVYVLRTSRLTVARDRLIVAAGSTLVIVGSALGFLYTRDRIALSAGVGYAMLVYVAVANLQSRAGGGQPWRLIGGACLAVVFAGWMIRVGETCFALRDAAWDNYQEWTIRYEALGGYVRPQTDVLELLREAALAQVPDDARSNPAWTYVLFERAHERIPAD